MWTPGDWISWFKSLQVNANLVTWSSGGSRGSTALGGGLRNRRLCAAWGRVRKGNTTPAGLGPAGPSPGTFLIIGCKWCILNLFFFAEFVLISPPKFCVNFAVHAPIYVMRENFYLRFRAKREFLYPLAEFSGVKGLPENFWLMN